MPSRCCTPGPPRPSLPGYDDGGVDSPSTASQRLMAQNAFQVLRAWPASTFAPGLDDSRRRRSRFRITQRVGRQRPRTPKRNPSDRHRRHHDRHCTRGVPIGPRRRIRRTQATSRPGVAVRDLIERLRSNDVDTGLIVAVRNQRGGTSRSPTAGGDQERDLAETHKAQSRRFREWPRTAAIFTSLASSYEHEAGLFDRTAEARRRGLPL